MLVTTPASVDRLNNLSFGTNKRTVFTKYYQTTYINETVTLEVAAADEIALADFKKHFNLRF